MDRQIQEKNENLRRLNEEKRRIEDEYSDQIKRLKEAIGMIKFKSNRLKKEYKNLSKQELEKYVRDIEHYAQNSKDYMNRHRKGFGEKEIGLLREVLLRNEDLEEEEEEHLNLSNVISQKNDVSVSNQKRKKIRNITNYILRVREKKKRGSSFKPKAPELAPKREISGNPFTEKRRSRNLESQQKSEQKNSNIKELINYEENRNQKNMETKNAIIEAKNTLRVNYENKLESLINNSKLTKNKIKKKISEVKVMYNKDKKKAERDVQAIGSKVRSVFQVCRKLEEIIQLNLQGEQALSRPWSMYRRSPSKKDSRPGSVSKVKWRQRVRFGQSLSKRAKSLFLGSSIEEVLEDEKVSRWVCEQIQAAMGPLEFKLNQREQEAEAKIKIKSEKKFEISKRDSIDSSRLESSFPL